MVYVCSDIHGYYDAYLDAVSLLGKDDKLYIIGDLIDRGSDGIKIILDIINRDNVIAIKGNHEQLMAETLEEIAFSTSEYDIKSIIEDSVAFGNIGQEETLISFSKLSHNDKIKVLNFIHHLPYYMEIEVNCNNYILVHGGLPDFDGAPIDYYDEISLLNGPHDYDINHYDDTTIIIGHTPTKFVFGAEDNKIFRMNDTINLDCGLGFDGEFGVLCLDTDEEIYF